LVIVVVLAAVFAITITNLISRFSMMAGQTRHNIVANENYRIGDEMAKMVGRAYEYGYQLETAACPSGYDFGSYSSGDRLCFPADSSAHPNCVKTTLNSSGSVCLDLVPSGVKVAVTPSGGQLYRFTASAPPRKNWTDLFISKAFAAPNYAPPPPTGFNQNAAPATCAGGSTLCRKCGPSQNHICVEITFCPADKITCLANEKITLSMMVQRF
jgi:hypothetical protein